VIFFNLEDETGLLNVVVLPEVWAEQKQLARRQPGLVITGVVEYRDGVTNLVAHRFEPLPVSPFPISGVKSRDFR
jgi:error-prone DNA polymerase